jgi:hypothetical protein
VIGTGNSSQPSVISNAAVAGKPANSAAASGTGNSGTGAANAASGSGLAGPSAGAPGGSLANTGLPVLLVFAALSSLLAGGFLVRKRTPA